VREFSSTFLSCCANVFSLSLPTTSTHTRAHRHTSSSLDSCSSIERGTTCLKTTSACVLTMRCGPKLIEVSSTHTPHTSRLRVAYTQTTHQYIHEHTSAGGGKQSQQENKHGCLRVRSALDLWMSSKGVRQRSQNTLSLCSPPIPAFPYQLTSPHTHTHTHTRTCTHTEGPT
jgi:hypothetical protein